MDNDTTVISELVARCIELSDGDISRVPFDEVCAEHPKLQSDVIEGVRVALTLPGLHAEGDVDRITDSILADRYRLEDRLGAGAMGVVYRATDLDLSRPLAIKVMQTNLMERSTALARFEREAAALAAVQHPSVVTIYDRGVTPDGTSFLAMELVEGVSCSRILELAREKHADNDSTDWLIEEVGLSEVQESSFLRQVMRWAADIASGLAVAHAAGVVHRDVKPSNIIIRPNGEAVLLDFGIAAKDDQATLTQTGAAVGTPAYMAPEALDGTKELRTSQDVWGLAATLYHMLTLEAPYKGGAHEVLAAIATREPVPAAKVRPGIPRDAQAILDHGLARDPRSRYSSLAAMESDLRALLAYRPVGVRPTSTLTRILRRARRSKVALGAALALAAVGLLQGYSAWEVRAAEKGRVAFEATWPAVRANASIVSTSNRTIPEGRARDHARSTLDALVEANHSPVIAHTLRAAFRADHGDPEGARRDMAAVARLCRTEFADHVAGLYDSVDGTAATAAGVTLDPAISPVTAEDHYLAGFHEMRALRYEESRSFFEHAGLAENRHVVELLQMMELNDIANLVGQARKDPSLWEEITARSESLTESVRARMQSDQYRGATSLNVIAAAHNFQGRYMQALEAAREGLEQSPFSHTLCQNGVKAAYHLGEAKEGLELADRGLEIVPGYPAILQEKTKCLALLGRFDEARELAETVHADTKRGRSQRIQMLARVDREAVRALAESEPEAAAAAADRALAELANLPGSSTFRRRNEQLIKALLEGDQRAYFVTLLADLRRDPYSPVTIRDVAETMPEELNPSEIALLSSWITAVSHVLAIAPNSTGR